METGTAIPVYLDRLKITLSTVRPIFRYDLSVAIAHNPLSMLVSGKMKQPIQEKIDTKHSPLTQERKKGSVHHIGQYIPVLL